MRFQSQPPWEILHRSSRERLYLEPALHCCLFLRSSQEAGRREPSLCIWKGEGAASSREENGARRNGARRRGKEGLMFSEGNEFIASSHFLRVRLVISCLPDFFFSICMERIQTQKSYRASTRLMASEQNCPNHLLPKLFPGTLPTCKHHHGWPLHLVCLRLMAKGPVSTLNAPCTM